MPLIWSVLDNNGGTSDSGERIALMQRYLTIFGAASVRLLLADREFTGLEWMDFLNKNNIPFAIRVKEKLIVTTEDGRSLALGSLLRKCRGVRTFRAALGREDPHGPLRLNFAARRLAGGELLIVASNTPARAALAAYRKRWAIECLFGDIKSQLASTSRTPGSSHRASSPCSSASSPPGRAWGRLSRSPGQPRPPRR